MINNTILALLSIGTFGFYGLSMLSDYMHQLQPIIDALKAVGN